MKQKKAVWIDSYRPDGPYNVHIMLYRDGIEHFHINDRGHPDFPSAYLRMLQLLDQIEEKNNLYLRISYD